MALMNCPECDKQVSDKAIACPHCGYPVPKLPVSEGIIKHQDIPPFKNTPPVSSPANDKQAWPTTPPDWAKPQVQQSKGFSFLTKFILSIIGLLVFCYALATIAFDPPTRPATSASSNEKDDSYLTGKFGTMNECMENAGKYLKQRGLKYELVSDKPKRVMASILTQDGKELTGKDHTFSCNKEESGTEGVYYELFLFLPSEYKDQ